MQKPRRPTGVTILGVLAILGGIFLLFAGTVLIGLATLASSEIATGVTNAGYPGLSSLTAGTITTIVTVLGAVILILGILYLVYGIGFFSGKGWAWTLGIIGTILGIILNIVQIALGSFTSISGLIIGLIIIYYLTRPHVKAYFGKGAQTAPVSGMPQPSTMSSSMGSGMASMTCKSCGASIPAGATRCPSCGASV